MIALVRHAPTTYNAKGLVRGHHDPPATIAGRQIAVNTGERFRGLPIDEVYSSDRQAAVLVARAISDATGAPLTLTPALRSWDLGDLQGKPVDEAQADISYYMRTPTEVPPHGTSWQAFVDTYLDFLRDHIHQPGYCVFVTHGRPIMVTRAWLSAGGEGTLDDGVLEADYSTFVPHGGWVILGGDQFGSIL